MFGNMGHSMRKDYCSGEGQAWWDNRHWAKVRAHFVTATVARAVAFLDHLNGELSMFNMFILCRNNLDMS